ncbi:hypothetical protein H4V99_000430 [Cryobacterium sp. CG_9.6]|nr:hypothetical protein [Cryobacterium sp. CG_9.6]
MLSTGSHTCGSSEPAEVPRRFGTVSTGVMVGRIRGSGRGGICSP